MCPVVAPMFTVPGVVSRAPVAGVSTMGEAVVRSKMGTAASAALRFRLSASLAFSIHPVVTGSVVR